MRGKKGFKIVVARRISQLRQALRTDTDRLRRKAIGRLEELFDLASDFAKGRMKWQTDGCKAVPITIKQRQMWARIAAYIAQIMNTIANGIDERQIDKDLTELARLVNEAKSKSQATGTPEEVRKEEGAPEPSK